MRMRMMITAVALGVCLGVSTAPVQAALTKNGTRLNGVKLNGLRLNGIIKNGLTRNGIRLNALPQNGISFNGSPTTCSAHDVVLQSSSREQGASPGVGCESLPFQSLSKQGLGKR